MELKIVTTITSRIEIPDKDDIPVLSEDTPESVIAFWKKRMPMLRR